MHGTINVKTPYAGLTNHVEQSSTSKHCVLTSQEITPVSWEKNVHYRVHKIPLLNGIMKHYSSWHPPTLHAYLI
jgi:hypothetical protein